MCIRANIKAIEHAPPGRHQIEGSPGLYLVVNENGSRRFLFRFVSPITRRPTEKGLGGWPTTSLALARADATKRAQAVRAGVDPIRQDREDKTSARGRWGDGRRDAGTLREAIRRCLGHAGDRAAHSPSCVETVAP